jgi:hypothetical protein
MRRTLLALLAAASAVAGGTALAQGGSTDSSTQPEPDVTAGSVFDLPSSAGCRHDRHLRVRFSPPAGAVFGSLEVNVRGRKSVRMTGVAGAASVTVRIPRGASHVHVGGETLGGQQISAARTYRICEPQPAAPPSGAPIQQGGGED